MPHDSNWRVFSAIQHGGHVWFNLGGNQWIDGDYAYYTADEDSKNMGIPYINQYTNNAPYGCEAASALEAMHYKGKLTDWNLPQFLKTMPISSDDNPYHGFAGTPYKSVSGVFQTIFPSSFVPWVSKYTDVTDISGASVDDIADQVKKGNPVVAWITVGFQKPKFSSYFWGAAVDNLHVLTVDGYNNAQFHVSDPMKGGYWISKTQFYEAYAPYHYAVAFN